MEAMVSWADPPREGGAKGAWLPQRRLWDFHILFMAHLILLGPTGSVGVPPESVVGACGHYTLSFAGAPS